MEQKRSETEALATLLTICCSSSYIDTVYKVMPKKNKSIVKKITKIALISIIVNRQQISKTGEKVVSKKYLKKILYNIRVSSFVIKYLQVIKWCQVCFICYCVCNVSVYNKSSWHRNIQNVAKKSQLFKQSTQLCKYDFCSLKIVCVVCKRHYKKCQYFIGLYINKLYI